MMNHNDFNRALFDRYLDLLEISSGTLSLDNLTEIVAAQLYRAPFENISKLYYRKKNGLRTLPGMKEYLDGIEHFRFGGTCYANNYYLYCLLRHLGYDIKLCGADMANPDVHLVSIVKLEGREYIIDVGYAAPFDHPLPRDLDCDYEINPGNNKYVLKPADKQGRSRLELYREGIYKHGYTVKPEARSIDEFADVIARSFADQATFVNALLLVRFYPHRSILVHNLQVIESSGGDRNIVHLLNRRELPRTIEHHFGIPESIVSEAIAGLGELGDGWN